MVTHVLVIPKEQQRYWANNVRNTVYHTLLIIINISKLPLRLEIYLYLSKLTKFSSNLIIFFFKVVNEDDEDSNDEGNWRNDYPDEDEDGDEDIDDENDEDGCLYYQSRKLNRNDEDYDDDYDEYGNGKQFFFVIVCFCSN